MAYSGHTIKFTMMIKRRSDFSEEEFHKYWTETHAPIVEKWLAKHGVIRYVQVSVLANDWVTRALTWAQYHTPSKERKKSEEVWQVLGGANISDFDGEVELTAPNLEALKSALNDPYYKSDVEPDEHKFLDASKSMRTMGWEELKIENNKVLRS